MMQASCSKCVLQQAPNCTTRQAVPDQKHRLISKTHHNAVRQRSNRIGGACKRSVSQEAVYAKTGPGGGVLDRPAVLPGFDNKGSTVKRKPPMYRVMLHNDPVNRREYVVRVLMKVVDGLTVDDAVNVMQEAHQNGMACVIECAQEDAERYCEGLRGNGLMASVEPAGGGGDSRPSE